MSDATPPAAVPRFVMLPGAGPVCEGDDCLPAASPVQHPQAQPAP